MDPDKKWVRRGWKACARSHRYWLVQTRKPQPFGNGDDSRLIYNNPWWFVFEFLIFMCFYLGKYVNVSACLNFYSFFLNKHLTLLGSTLHGSMNNKSNVRRILFTTEIPFLFLFFHKFRIVLIGSYARNKIWKSSIIAIDPVEIINLYSNRKLTGFTSLFKDYEFLQFPPPRFIHSKTWIFFHPSEHSNL